MKLADSPNMKKLDDWLAVAPGISTSSADVPWVRRHWQVGAGIPVAVKVITSVLLPGFTLMVLFGLITINTAQLVSEPTAGHCLNGVAGQLPPPPPLLPETVPVRLTGEPLTACPLTVTARLPDCGVAALVGVKNTLAVALPFAGTLTLVEAAGGAPPP